MPNPRFSQTWAFDTEFRTDPGGLPHPVCMTAVEVATGQLADKVRRSVHSANAMRFASQHRGAALRMARRIASLMRG